MKRLLAGLLVLAIAGSACGQTPPVTPPVQPPAPAPVVPPVRVPTGPVVPTPVPSSAPVTITKDKTYYVFDSDVPCIVLVSPQSMLSVTADTGPMKVRQRFADDPSKVQTRHYTGKYVYSLDPTGLGAVELLVVPQAAKAEADVIRRSLLVDDGSSPTPPPTPNPPAPTPTPPGPTPPAPVDPGVQAMIDAFKADKVPSGTAAKLAVVCHTMANTVSQDQTVATYQDVFNSFSGLADPVLDKTSTPAIHKLIGGAIMAAFGSTPTTAVDRALVSKTFTTIATQLEGVK